MDIKKVERIQSPSGSFDAMPTDLASLWISISPDLKLPTAGVEQQDHAGVSQGLGIAGIQALLPTLGTNTHFLVRYDLVNLTLLRPKPRNLARVIASASHPRASCGVHP